MLLGTAPGQMLHVESLGGLGKAFQHGERQLVTAMQRSCKPEVSTSGGVLRYSWAEGSCHRDDSVLQVCRFVQMTME